MSALVSGVYEPSPALGFQWVQPLSEDDFDRVYRLDGSSVVSDWSRVPVKLFAPDERGGRPADLPWLSTGGLVLSERAYLEARGLLAPSGEFLELRNPADRTVLWLYNVTVVVDALDEEHADVERFASSERIMKIKRAEFIDERLIGITFFRIPQSRSIYMAGDATQELERLMLPGVQFQLVWESSDVGGARE